MSYYDDEYLRRRRVFPIVLISLVSAVIGGLLSLSLVPLVYGTGTLQMPNVQGSPSPSTPPGQQTQIYLDYSPVVSIAEQVGPAIVGISNIGWSRDFFGTRKLAEKGSGSGVIISKDGYIVTNNHVIANAEKLIVHLADKREFEAELVGADPDTDLAVLKIAADNLPVAILGDSDQVRVGELAVAIGNPLGHELARSVTVGVVSATQRSIMIQDRKFNLIQTDAAINPGNSGGALVNGQGHVIGINTVKLVEEGVEGIGFAIPISDAKPIIEALIARGYVSRPALGIWGMNIDEVTATVNNLPKGIYIDRVIEGGAAQKAGLQAKDIITAINGLTVETFDDLNQILKNFKPGDEINITLYREGKSISIPLILGERRSNE